MQNIFASNEDQRIIINTNTKGYKMEEKFIHIVYFWLKQVDNQADREKFEISLSNFINNSNQVVSHHIGRPAGTDRPVVDGSFTYSLVVSFKSKEDHDIYQADPAHHEFIAECESLWERVQVYDSVKLGDS